MADLFRIRILGAMAAATAAGQALNPPYEVLAALVVSLRAELAETRAELGVGRAGRTDIRERR